jgi:hypothetical protein
LFSLAVFGDAPAVEMGNTIFFWGGLKNSAQYHFWVLLALADAQLFKPKTKTQGGHSTSDDY